MMPSVHQSRMKLSAFDVLSDSQMARLAPSSRLHQRRCWRSSRCSALMRTVHLRSWSGSPRTVIRCCSARRSAS
jgi:hypothetical protein